RSERHPQDGPVAQKAESIVEGREARPVAVQDDPAAEVFLEKVAGKRAAMRVANGLEVGREEGDAGEESREEADGSHVGRVEASGSGSCTSAPGLARRAARLGGRPTL